MTSQSVELILTLIVSGVALVIVSKLNKGKKKGDPRNFYMGEGQFLDPNSYSGNIHAIVLGLLVCFAGWYLDEFGRWLWHQFGNELIVSSSKEAWHRIVTTMIGAVFIIGALVNLARIFLLSRRSAKVGEIEKLPRVGESKMD